MSSTSDPLYNILLHTYHADKGLRTQAEQALASFVQSVPHALTNLILCVKNREMDINIRKAAAIQVKNRVRSNWKAIATEHKDSSKSELIITILDENDNSIRRLLADTFRKIVDYEYPERWPNLLTGILAMAQTNNVLRMHNAFVLIRQIAKLYEFKGE